MTFNQLQSLTEDELAMVLVIVNVIDPLTIPQKEFTPQQLAWFRHDMLIEKLLNAFPRLKPEGFAIFTSLMEKLGVKIEIQQQQPPVEQPATELPISASTAETTGSI